jgi:arsenite-transporting ATPase
MWKANQQDNISFIGEAFGELPVLKLPLFGKEVTGLDSLRQLGNLLYDGQNPAQKLFDGHTHQIETDSDGTHTLIVPLPFANKEDMDLYRSRDEITLRVGPYRRNIVLPYALWDLEIADARFEQSTLRIQFRKDERVQKQRVR